MFARGAADGVSPLIAMSVTYFIRLNSEQPIESLLGNAMFREQVGKLAALGLAEP